LALVVQVADFVEVGGGVEGNGAFVGAGVDVGNAAGEFVEDAKGAEAVGEVSGGSSMTWSSSRKSETARPRASGPGQMRRALLTTARTRGLSQVGLQSRRASVAPARVSRFESPDEVESARAFSSSLSLSISSSLSTSFLIPFNRGVPVAVEPFGSFVG
jgi:hypothetical protein